MRNLRYATACLILGLILVAVPAMSYNGQVKTVGGSGYGPYQTGLGGEFTLGVLSPDLLWILDNGYVPGLSKNVAGITNSFQTFCLEGSEHIYSNTTYNVVLSDKAIYGGVGASGDPISLGTAWLYRLFATGGLDSYGYDYTNPGRSSSAGGLPASAGELQDAIWWLEGEQGIVYTAANSFMLAVVNEFGSELAAKKDASGAYGVGVLNMYSLDGNRRQDQLVLTAAVPEPPVLLLLGICLAGLAMAAGTLNKVRV